MKRFRWLNIAVTLALTLALLPYAQEEVKARPVQDIGEEDTYFPGQLVVAFEEGQSVQAYPSKALTVARDLQGSILKVNGNLALLKLNAQADLADAVQRVGEMAGVAYAQPNYIYRIPESKGNFLGEGNEAQAYTMENQYGKQVTMPWEQAANLETMRSSVASYTASSTLPSELPSGKHWGWDQVQADLIWSNATTAKGVCLVDTGVDKDHPDLTGRVTWAYDYVNNDSVPSDDNGHGTHLAGIIAALANNSTGSALGVSNGIVVAMKALNAQGVGSTYSVAAAVRACAARSDISVINLSLVSSTADLTVYNALSYATSTKLKLVVTAAGNSSSSAPVFPAAWANQHYKNTGVYYSSSTPKNSLYTRLISVGGGRPSTGSVDYVWVDKNGNNAWTDSELYTPEKCSTGIYDSGTATGSNYGRWVTLVAPGGDIYSTTPTSNPFYMNYYQGVKSGYDYLGGTSMSAAFVSGAAARTWAIISGSTAATVKTKLVSSGKTLDFAVDGYAFSGSFNPRVGYKNSPERPSREYGVPFESSSKTYVMAPFCWPSSSSPFGAEQTMSTARYLNVAAAMNRGAIMGEIKDAVTGLPLSGVKVYAKKSTTQLGYISTVSGNARFLMIDVSIPDGSSSVALKVNKSGYTYGDQTINAFFLYSTSHRGVVYENVYNNASLPPIGGVQFVLDWKNPTSDIADLDMFIWLPKVTSSAFPKFPTAGGFIGPDDIQNYAQATNYKALHLGVGTILSPTAWGATDLTAFSPYAQHFFDGGEEEGTDTESYSMQPFEFARITYGPYLTSKPYYKPKYGSFGQYVVMITDYSKDGGAHYIDYAESGTFVYPILRVWVKGYLVATSKIVSSSPSSCKGSGHDWWKIVFNSDSTKWNTWASNSCGTGDGFMPYLAP